jgi:hypothetical protein
MHNKTISLNKGQKISQLDFFKMFGLIANAIYHKTIPGCGFTRYAIEFFLHHVICILPNVPVIQDKVRKHNEMFPDREILGVHKGITIARIKEYLQSDVEYKKILTTPEGFMDKVLKAFKDPEEMKQMFFLLFDECERIVTDVSYRGAIAAPLNMFFEFPKKAMVSATTLQFSDDRFKDFSHYYIEPTYDYSIPLTVINTNNIAEAVKKHIEIFNSEHNCIFFNSTMGINAVINNLDIAVDSIAFCAEDSVLNLKEKGFSDAYSDFDTEFMRQYNFFTSRYFSAIDMELDYKPDVIIVTDVFFAKHSIIDPQTEAIQIAGRFRNGVNSITHITNYNPNMEWMNREEAFYYLKGSLSTYEGFVCDYEKATNPGSKKTFHKAIESADEQKYYINGKLNHFMVDNFIHEERVKGYYEKPEHLEKAYDNVSKHFTVAFEEDNYMVEDSDLYMLHSKQTKKEKWQTIAELFDKWTPKVGRLVFAPSSLFSKLIAKYPLIYKAYLAIGLEGLEGADYVEGAIDKAVKEAETKKQTEWIAIKVYALFEENTTYIVSDIIHGLERIYKEAGLSITVRPASICRYFKADRTTLKGEKAYKLGKKLY